MILVARANGTVACHLATELVTGFHQIMRRHRDSGMAGEISPKVQQLLARALRSFRFREDEALHRKTPAGTLRLICGEFAAPTPTVTVRTPATQELVSILGTRFHVDHSFNQS